MSKIAKIDAFLSGNSYIDKGAAQGLANYHTAAAVRNALLKRDPMARLQAVRMALKQYRVQVWPMDGKLRFCCAGKSEMIL